MDEERGKLRQVQTDCGLDRDGGDQIGQPKSDEKVLYEVPECLDVDPLKINNREIVDKPIQWTAGMMEIPTDPMNKVRTMELMLHQHTQNMQKQKASENEAISESNFDAQCSKFLRGHQQKQRIDRGQDRKILNRGPRGGFKGCTGTHGQK